MENESAPTKSIHCVADDVTISNPSDPLIGTVPPAVFECDALEIFNEPVLSFCTFSENDYSTTTTSSSTASTTTSSSTASTTTSSTSTVIPSTIFENVDETSPDSCIRSLLSE